MASPATTTSTVNLFLEPTPACSFAVSVAIDSLDYLTNEQELVIEPQSVSNPDVSGIGVSYVDADTVTSLADRIVRSSSPSWQPHTVFLFGWYLHTSAAGCH